MDFGKPLRVRGGRHPAATGGEGLAFVTVLAIAAGVSFARWDLLGARELKPERRIDSQTLFDRVRCPSALSPAPAP